MNTRNASYTRVHRLTIRHARSTIVIRPYHFLDFVNPAAAEVTTDDEAKQLLSGPSPLPLSPSLMFSARSSQLVPCQEWANLWTLPWQATTKKVKCSERSQLVAQCVNGTSARKCVTVKFCETFATLSMISRLGSWNLHPRLTASAQLPRKSGGVCLRAKNGWGGPFPFAEVGLFLRGSKKFWKCHNFRPCG